MIIRYSVLRAAIPVLTIIIMFIAASALAQSSETDFMQRQSGLIQQDADSALRYAEKLRSQAAQYRELAESADRYAAQAANIKDKADWEKTAQGHRQKAEKLEQDAAAAEEKAKQADADAADIQNQIEDKKAQEAARQEEYDRKAAEIAARDAARKEAEDNNPNTGLRVGNIIGLWRDAAHEDEPFVIVQKDPRSEAYPNKIEAHTPRRVWSGDFHTDPPPGEPLITLSYKPKAAEMNPEIPAWARKKIEGELEWRLEINGGGTCGTPALSADFYPGEVTWKENEGWGLGKGTVTIEGKGEARRIDLHQSVPDMRFYSYGAAQLYLRPPGMKQQKSDEEAAKTGDFNEQLDTVDALVHGQRFFVDVVLPFEEAEKQGEKLTVDIKASGGDKTTLELQRGALRRGRSVIYTHYDPITIADPLDVTEEDRDPPLLSINYILGYQGARIDLDVENGELVTFSYGQAQQTIPVFNSWVQRGINKHQEAVQRLRPFFSLIISDPTKTAAQKEEATKRLTMIANYEHIMASDKIHDFIRNKIGEAYFYEYGGLINMTREAINQQAEFTNSYRPLTGDERDGSKSRSGIYNGVVWTSGYEKYLIENTAVRARLEYREIALREIPTAITFAMYETVAGMSGVGDVFTISTGKDIFGKPVPQWQRIMAAVSLASSNILSFTAPHMMAPPSLRSFNPAQLSGRAMRAGANMRLKTHEHLGAKYGAQKLEAAMKTLKAEQAHSVSPGGGKAEEITLSENPVGCGRNPGGAATPPTNTSAPPPHPQPLDGAILDVKRMAGQNTEVVNPGAEPLLPPQEFETCQCASTQLAMKEDLGTAISEMSQFGMLVRKGHIKPGGDMPLANGYSDAQLVAFLQETGAEVIVVPARGGRPLTLEAMNAWMERGWHVRDVIRTVDKGIPHAIEPRRFSRNAKGEIEEVQWFDPAFGKELKTPACDYINKLAAKNYDTVMYRWKTEGETGGAPSAAAKPTIEHPAAAPKPTIEYPAQRNPGARAEESAQTSRRREDIDVTDVEILDGLTEPQRQARHLESNRLAEKLQKMYPRKKDIPRINCIARARLKDIYRDLVWQPPQRGGASFSYEGNNIVVDEVVAVRVRPESLGRVSWKDFEGRGLVPEYWPSGKIGEGKSSTYIPAEHLEWIDADQPGWQSFPAKGEATGFGAAAGKRSSGAADAFNPLAPEEFDPTAPDE